MNILYCGDKNILDGLIISVLSIVKNTKENVHFYVLTMSYKGKEKSYKPLSKKDINYLDKVVKKYNKNNFIKLIDVTDIVKDKLPLANIDTRFTPYCMLRLYADLIDEIPDKILYLDNDVVCLKNPIDFYNINNSNYELVGVLDYYGSHFYRKNILKKDYLNSGVLLLNMDLIKKTKLFEKCKNRCREKKMFLPDQAALNHYASKKLIVNRIYNEQKQDTADTVFRHFTTTFKFWPKITTQTIKPWNIEELHNTLKVYRFDDVLEEYKKIKEGIK